MVGSRCVLAVSFAALLFTSTGCAAPHWVRLANGQMDLVARARPIVNVLRETKGTDDPRMVKIRGRLNEVLRARDFAEELGLDVGSTYRDYVDVGAAPVYVLAAAPPDRLELRRWNYPLVGSFPYRGFFDLEAARRLARRLEGEGLEVSVRPAAAYSTLGWFPDPVFSSMLRGTRGETVEVLFHELTHRTVFFKHDLRFNENLATFVGEEAARRYLAAHYGAEAPELAEYEAILRDQLRFREVVGELRTALERAFEAPERSDRLAARERLFAAVSAQLAATPFETERYRGWAGAEWSIPLLMHLDLYVGANDVLADALARCDGDLPRFIEWAGSLSSSKDGVSQLRDGDPPPPSPER